MKDEELFDNLINQKLTEASVPTPLGVWETFNQSDAMQAHMQGQNFDAAVRQHMSQMTVPPIGNEWGAFKKHWDTATVQNENAFDHAVHTKVKQSNPYPGPEANTILQNAIQQSIIYRRQIWIGKFAEMAFIIIVVASLFHFLPEFGSFNSDKKKNIPTEEIHPSSPTDNIFDRADAIIPSHDVLDEPSVPTVSLLEANPANNHTGEITANNPSHIALNLSGKIPLNPHDKLDPATNLAERQIMPLKGESISTYPETELTDLNDGASMNASETIAETDLPEVMTIDVESSKVGSSISPFANNIMTIMPAQIATLHSTAESLYANGHHLGLQSAPIKIGNGRKIISEMWIGAKIGQAYNLIRTPVSNIQSRSYQYQNINSSIAGFNLELKSDYVNVETGLYYSFKLFGQGNYDKDRGHFVNIPLSLKKDFFTKKKLSPYLKAGPDFTMLVKAEYDPNLDNSSYQNLPTALAPSKDFANATVEDGIIHSGNLTRNSYFGIHGGIGVEYKFSNANKLALEIMHQLNPFDKGLGINNHKFTETSINLGYKHILNYN